ncbi:hypothetical protein EDD86DRAFT_199320 [Gorgonomyces haynaldii]|nr:hypothetical protein EDD86DRAFT_199320 [Gorgonomyces haynaldii]
MLPPLIRHSSSKVSIKDGKGDVEVRTFEPNRPSKLSAAVTPVDDSSSSEEEEIIPVVQEQKVIDIDQASRNTSGMIGNDASNPGSRATSRRSSLVGNDKNIIVAYLEYAYWYLKDLYSRKVSYRIQFLFELWCMLPFVFMIVFMTQIETIVFPSVAIADGYLVLMIVVGLTAVELSRKFTKRHAQVVTVRKFVSHRGHVQDIYSVGKKPANLGLVVTSLIFYVCLLLTEVNIQKNYFQTPLGNGFASSMSLDLDSIVAGMTPTEKISTFMIGLGVPLGCNDCGSISRTTYSLIPVSTILKNTYIHSDTAILERPSDMIGLEVNCNTLLVPTNTGVATGYVEISSRNLIATAAGAKFDVYLTARNPLSLNITSRSCSVAMYDLRGIAAIKYTIDEYNFATKYRGYSVKPENDATCTKFKDFCLNRSIRSQMSYSFANLLFGSGHNITIPQAYSYTAGLMPDPSDFWSDSDYSGTFRKTIEGLILATTVTFMTRTSDSPLNTDSVGIQLSVPSGILITANVAAGLAIFFAVFLFLVEYVQLDQIPDGLMKQLHARIKLGPLQTISLSQLARESFEAGNKDWDLDVVKFGEDRKTRSENVGVLRFGHHGEIVRFNPERKYRTE